MNRKQNDDGSAEHNGREAILQYLERHLVGPVNGAEELLADVPNRRYLMATLFPRESEADTELQEEEQEAPGPASKDEVAEDPVALSNSWMPSSVGLSFFVSQPGLVKCSVWGARYEEEKAGRRKFWRRVTISDPATPETVSIEPPKAAGYAPGRSALSGRARITSFWRPLPGGFLVTVVLVNHQRRVAVEAGKDARVDPSLCLHQVGIRCAAGSGKIMDYPSVDVLSSDAEDEELRLQHRKARVFAIGHGCSADWKPGDESDASVSYVESAHLPVFELPALTHEGHEDSDVLRIARLADPDQDIDSLFRDLREFAAGYDSWIADLPRNHSDIPGNLVPAATRILERLTDVANDLRAGIDALEADPILLRVFQLANLAMLMQMRHASPEVAGTRRVRNEGVTISSGYLKSDRRWRPFQLAFILLCIPSIANPHSEDRDTVDLLWFSTGGGKTEAYLALAAFQILLRRFKNGDRGAGTTVITRYTLRLLTAQQFQRATTLVCALELLRRQYRMEMGEEPISIGLWVGEDQTPNDLVKAREFLAEMLEQVNPVNRFQIHQCPWCGTEIVPTHRQPDEKSYGVRVGNESFTLFCTSSACAFHDKLPISVVDEDLYRSPPSFLLATVDKFARLAWVESAVSFFGGGRFDPPSLIIQDEMHLLSGPLGTTVAIYEGAIEALTTFHGARPKIIASTATIRNAGEQARGLFGRNVRLFPPPGLAADDSYFASIDRSRRGRKYIGVMAQSHTPQTSIIHTCAALLEAPLEISLSKPEKNSYWTLVAYHNSIRELGRTAMLARDDIPSRIEIIATDQSNKREIDEPDTVELTGNVRGEQLTEILNRLSIPEGDPGAISVLITTNMLSVGVDIPRLGLMLVNGQPKSTSEYIQATSRVGRASVPGLIVVMYNSTKPRDRSHYETFRAYHSALYRHVEPTSVTPFSVPSRKRALHAALVILMRHGAGLAADDRAGEFDLKDDAVKNAVAALLSRVERVDPIEYDATKDELARLCAEWGSLASTCRAEGLPLFYKPGGKAHRSLLRDFGSQGEGWETLHSMRSIDRQCNVTVIGEQ